MTRNGDSTLLYDWLTELGVPSTPGYCREQYRSMPFHTLFGLNKVLGGFGVDSEAVEVADKRSLDVIELPFVAVAAGRSVVVTEVNDDSVGYKAGGRSYIIPRDRFTRLWSGVAMIAYPTASSREPSYLLHRNIEIAASSKKYILAAALIVVLAYFFVTRRLYAQWSTCLLAIIDLCGIYISTLLVRHQLGFHDAAADKVCGAIQAGGCNSVLNTSASKFFGLFGWSEVGLSYFTVTFLTMLIFPEHTGWLALVNLCCLPYSFWSVWYQRFRAKAWCTMCLSIQAMLWLQFACYLGGGWWAGGFHLSSGIIILGATYVAALLGLNAVMPMADQKSRRK